MKKRTFTTLALTAALLTAVFVFQTFHSSPVVIPTVAEESHNTVIASETKQSFLDADQQTQVTGLIVPHFAPVSNLIIDALKQVTTTPDLIILIGPNHYEVGTSPIITGVYNSAKLQITPKFATEQMQRLAKIGAATKEDSIISGDHSIGTPLPFIALQFPNTPILPIILKYHQNLDNIQKLLSALQSISARNTLIIASVDFSHYLSSAIAPQKDTETQKYIAEHNYAKLEKLSNDFIDSPWSLITFLKYLEQNGVQNGRELAHINTGQLAGQIIESSTSFFTYIYKK